MTPDQQRSILEAAAKACGWYGEGPYLSESSDSLWNPLIKSADTASMCTNLEISTQWLESSAHCDIWLGPKVRKPHDGTPEGKGAAWRLAASMVAAKVGGYEE